MIFNGIKDKGIPQPNPGKVSLAKNSSINDIFMKTKELYFFSIKNLAFKDLCIADSNGVLIEIENLDTWKLEDYYSINNYQFCRHKLFVMYMAEEKVNVLELFLKIYSNSFVSCVRVFGIPSDDDEDEQGSSSTGVLKTCVSVLFEFFFHSITNSSSSA